MSVGSLPLRCPRRCQCPSPGHQCVLDAHQFGLCDFIATCGTGHARGRTADDRRMRLLDWIRGLDRPTTVTELNRAGLGCRTLLWRDVRILADAGVVRMSRERVRVPGRGGGGAPSVMIRATALGPS